MRIAYVYDNAYPYYVGGVEKRIWEISRRLSQKGHEVHMYCMKYWTGNDIINQDGIYLHGVCKPMSLFSNNRRSIREAIYFACKVLSPLLKEKYDIIDVQNFPYFSTFPSKYCVVYRRSKIVITWHEVWGKYWFEYLGIIGSMGLLVERLVALMSNEMIAVSESTASSLKMINQKANISIVPNGIDFKQIHKVKPNGHYYDIVFAGRLIKEKGLELLLDSVNLIKNSRPNIKCLIIGNGPMKEELEKLITNYKLQNNVFLKGFIGEYEDLIAQIKNSSTFVLPSTREGFGIVVLEANAAGVPVVTIEHARNAAKELVTDGKNGYVSKPNPNYLASAIMMAIDNSKDLEQECTNFAEKYDWDNIVNYLENYYKNLA
ncbi:glycosyltransferase [Desulfocucumis palustris]|uniref:Glycosyltransferase n=1 Tax=Desulfocucumis palustris TaxID=1898651 RepID=A0A2L2XDY0_9FIRM|nr:glycosyltransferase family 4 protein [Desulfocucumis palustris]GBF33923.1 glycosyltransferase [Desulfocucumis palustris]